jgi:hypothetical protein
MSCPPPIGTVPKEDCTEIADDFGALTVDGALKVAGGGKEAELKLEAIRAVATLAQSIKEQRVKLCEAYVKCKVPLAERDAQDQKLASGMRALIDAWNKRRFSGLDEVMRFREQVRVIERRVNGGDAAPPPPKPPRTLKAEEALVRIEDAGVAFRVDGSSLAVSATAEGKRDALKSKAEALGLASGHRYRIKVSGAYKPASPALITPGDELVARLKYRAAGAADLVLALRSLEDPDASEASDAFKAAPNEKGAHEAKLVADPLQTGFYLGVTVKGAPVDLDDIELSRGGKVIAAARAEEGSEPFVKSECALEKAKPIAGKQSLRCQPGDGDRVTIGKPDGFLVITLKDASGARASLRTLSLDGGRSVDASVSDDAELVFTLVGAGSATIEKLEITDLGI